MAYEQFAYCYDALNEDANYDLLFNVILDNFKENGIQNGIVADFGCGTGEVSLRLANSGYDMICIDSSIDMLTNLKEKIPYRKTENAPEILLLCQKLENLDLFGTIRAAVSTFDTFNHLKPKELEECIKKISIFMEPNGILIFDMNTPYKHKNVLQNYTFSVESKCEPGLICEWENTLNNTNNSTNIYLEISKNDKILFTETFTEYFYNYNYLNELLSRNKFRALSVRDGETFLDYKDNSSRIFIVAQRLT